MLTRAELTKGYGFIRRWSPSEMPGNMPELTGFPLLLGCAAGTRERLEGGVNQSSTSIALEGVPPRLCIPLRCCYITTETLGAWVGRECSYVSTWSLAAFRTVPDQLCFLFTPPPPYKRQESCLSFLLGNISLACVSSTGKLDTGTCAPSES